MMVAIHSADFIRRRATGEAHIVPGSHAFRSSRCTTTKPKPRASPVPTTKYGRNGSNVVARPAPLRPRATAMSGPAQQSADATAAAIPPVAATTVLVVDVAMVFQCLQNRAVVGRLSGRACSGQPLQRALHAVRSEEHTSELQSQSNLVCRLLLEKKKKNRDRKRIRLNSKHRHISDVVYGLKEKPPDCVEDAYCSQDQQSRAEKIRMRPRFAVSLSPY